jgi:2-phosphosulfolactate phosphatase
VSWGHTLEHRQPVEHRRPVEHRHPDEARAHTGPRRKPRRASQYDIRVTDDPHAQTKYQVRFEWGSAGAATIAPGANVFVLIDAISFTTTVELAVAHGLEVIPFAGVGDPADAAAPLDAAVAGPRGAFGVSLSPSSITAESVAGLAPRTRVVMPSLNGSRVSAALAGYGIPVLAASLRNRTAVANWILDYQAQLGERVMVAVIAAGEARPDGSLRFAVEDLLAAGSVIDALAELGIDYCSPEAAAASAAFVGLKRATAHLLTASGSGQELNQAGQLVDVQLAGQLDVSSTVPVLRECGYRS